MPYILIVIIVVFILLRKKKKSIEPEEKQAEIVFSTTADQARGFGYKTIWFAVKSTETEKIALTMGLKDTHACNWEQGISESYNGSVFVCPPIDHWTLVCGDCLPNGSSLESIESVNKMLQKLSQTFGEAQFFGTHRVVEYHAWGKAKDGKILRYYSYLGESGENILVEGEADAFEQSLNLGNTFSEEAKAEDYLEREDILWPNEETVMQVAANWSINPTILDERTDVAPAMGILGKM